MPIRRHHPQASRKESWKVFWKFEMNKWLWTKQYVEPPNEGMYYESIRRNNLKYLDAWKICIIFETCLEDRLHLRKIQIYLVFRSICTIVAPWNIVDRATAFCTHPKSPVEIVHRKTAVSSHRIAIWMWALAVSICVEVCGNTCEKMFIPLSPASFFRTKVFTIF